MIPASHISILICITCSAYGDTKRYKSVERIVKVNNNTMIGASGEISDFQYIQVCAVPCDSESLLMIVCLLRGYFTSVGI